MNIKYGIAAAFFCMIFILPVRAQNLTVSNGGKAWSALWQQRAAEYKALCFQAYNIAKLRVNQTIKNKHGKPLAIITDIDETLLDNSPEDARAAITNQEYNPNAWKKWTTSAAADTVPGAAAFFKYAAKKGIEVFYISNRDEDEREGTLKNLKFFNLPYADNAHLLLKNGTSSKEMRRQKVLKNFDVVLLCGDNLADFDVLYENHPNQASRTATTQNFMQKFGSKFIVLPNPSYGDWEGALFNYNYKLSPAQKDSVIKSSLKID